MFEKSKGLKNWASVEEIMANYLKDYQIIDFISHTIADAVSAEKIGTNLEKYAELGLSRTPYSERSFILKFITYSILHKDVSSIPQNDMYKKMQEKYDKLKINYTLQTNIHQEALATYVRFKVNISFLLLRKM